MTNILAYLVENFQLRGKRTHALHILNQVTGITCIRF